MEGIVPVLVGMVAGVVLATIAFLDWIYEPEGIPPLPHVLEHLRGMRALVRIIRTSSDALAQMLEVARRPR
jgi:hypothetical protein